MKVKFSTGLMSSMKTQYVNVIAFVKRNENSWLVPRRKKITRILTIEEGETDYV